MPHIHVSSDDSHNITLLLYLNGLNKPVICELESEKSLDKFYELLRTNDIIKFGPIIFERSQFRYALIK